MHKDAETAARNLLEKLMASAKETLRKEMVNLIKQFDDISSKLMAKHQQCLKYEKLLKSCDEEVTLFSQFNRLAVLNFSAGAMAETERTTIETMLRNLDNTLPKDGLKENTIKQTNKLLEDIYMTMKFDNFEAPAKRIEKDPLLASPFSVFNNFVSLSQNDKVNLVSKEANLYYKSCIKSLINMIRHKGKF